MRGDVSVEVVAKLSGMSKATITRNCQAGTFRNAYQLGGSGCQWHIPAEDVAALYPEAKRAVVLAKLEQLAQMHELK